ncbi:MAG: C39 family peptidase [Chloroflexi bacterium]|nr:C39 family peptidase [Chloroflexota bacterium]MBI3338923.1 C39 family peptidase [Chloroflexota bacterium]
MAFNLVRYSQQDPQWKNDNLGNSTDDTLGTFGCAVTSVAMYLSGWGYPETPKTVNKKLAASGGFLEALIVWGAVSSIHPQIKFKGLTISRTTEAPLAQIDASLAAGQPVLVEMDRSTQSGFQTHWVVLYAKKGGDYLMLDPWPYPVESGENLFGARYAFGKPLKNVITAVAWYEASATGSGTTPPPPSGTSSGSTTTTPSTPMPTPVETDLIVQVVASATAGIRLHIAASQDSPANFAEMPGTQLRVIEDKAGALAKIGSQQWIYVRDQQGNQGYVAAWYVEKAAGAAPTSTTPAPATGSAPEPVPASTPATPSAPTPPAPAPQRFQVIVSSSVGAAGLAVRQQPSQGSATVNMEKAGARLTVIEPASSATPKIGVAGQWIAVKATNNKQGYVAAQYVKAK